MIKQEDHVNETQSVAAACNWDNAFDIVVIGGGPVGMEYIKRYHIKLLLNSNLVNGKVILAEFGFGGKLLPMFPLDPTIPGKIYWFLKTTVFLWIYWNGMLKIKSKEWLARCGKSS